MSTAAAEPTSMEQVGKAPDWWKLGDGAMLLAYACVTLWTIRYHEKWADEAQAWLIARDLDLRTIWFHELRYEGSPGLWHTILWIAQHAFHARYEALGYIGLAFAMAGATVLLFKAPFPRIVRWPLAFTYVMVYQYAVIARPYTLLPLLVFCAAILFKDLRRPERMTIVLILLAFLTLHGTILAACLGLAYLVDVWKNWSNLEAGIRHRCIICIGLMAATFLFIAVILKPTPDVEVFALKHELARAPEAVKNQFPDIWRKLRAVLTGAFLDYLIPSTAFVVLTGAWCYSRRKFLAYALPVAAMIALYGGIHGAAHHHGTLFLAAVTGMWIAWPTTADAGRFSPREALATKGAVLLLLGLCLVNVWDAAVVIKHEYLYPYSGSLDAANYLKQAGADRGPMFGFLHGVVGVQAYFDHNIFANVPTSYFHHGLPLDGTRLDLEQLNRIRPGYIVAYSDEPEVMAAVGSPELTSRGYELAHFSDGYYLYKQGVFERESYFIFRRLPENAQNSWRVDGNLSIRKEDGHE